MQPEPWLKGNIEEAQGLHALLKSGNLSFFSKKQLVISHLPKTGLNALANPWIQHRGEKSVHADVGRESGTPPRYSAQDGFARTWTAYNRSSPITRPHPLPLWAGRVGPV